MWGDHARERLIGASRLRALCEQCDVYLVVRCGVWPLQILWHDMHAYASAEACKPSKKKYGTATP